MHVRGGAEKARRMRLCSVFCFVIGLMVGGCGAPLSLYLSLLPLLLLFVPSATPAGLSFPFFILILLFQFKVGGGEEETKEKVKEKEEKEEQGREKTKRRKGGRERRRSLTSVPTHELKANIILSLLELSSSLYRASRC